MKEKGSTSVGKKNQKKFAGGFRLVPMAEISRSVDKSEKVNLTEGGGLFNDLGEWDEHISKIVQNGDSSEIHDEKIADQGLNALLGYVSGVVNYSTSPLSWLGSKKSSRPSPVSRSNPNNQKAAPRASPSRWGLTYVQCQFSLAVNTITSLFFFPIRRRNKPIHAAAQVATDTNDNDEIKHDDQDGRVRRRLQLERPNLSDREDRVDRVDEVTFTRCRSSQVSNPRQDGALAHLERGQSLPVISSTSLTEPPKEHPRTGSRHTVPALTARRLPQIGHFEDESGAPAPGFSAGSGPVGSRRRPPIGGAQLRMTSRMPRISPEAKQWCAAAAAAAAAAAGD
jgi:hypothetical protein